MTKETDHYDMVLAMITLAIVSAISFVLSKTEPQNVQSAQLQPTAITQPAPRIVGTPIVLNIDPHVR